MPSASAAQGVGLDTAHSHPVLGRYFSGPGKPNVQAIIQTPDAELAEHVKLLHPDARRQLQQQISTFQPSFGQRIGARAMGIDIDAARERFRRLLEKAASSARKKLLSEKITDWGREHRDELERTAWSGLGATGLTGAGLLTRSGLNMAAPSYLDLAHYMWSDPANLERLSQAVGAERARQLAGMSRRKLWREILKSPELLQATFRSGPNLDSIQTGDIGVSSYPDYMTRQIWRDRQQILTGGRWHHVDVGLGGRDAGWYGVSPGEERSSFGNNRAVIHGWDKLLNGQEFIHMRPRAVASLSPEAAEEAVIQRINRAVINPGPYEYYRLGVAGLREVAPELATREGSMLHRFLGTRPMRWIAKMILPKNSIYHKMTDPTAYKVERSGTLIHPEYGPVEACPGGICSTWAADVANQVRPGGVARLHLQTPNELVRQAMRDRNMQIMGMHLPSGELDARWLRRQHLMKYGPLALRALPIVGMAGLGTYGLYRALHPHKE